MTEHKQVTTWGVFRVLKPFRMGADKFIRPGDYNANRRVVVSEVYDTDHFIDPDTLKVRDPEHFTWFNDRGDRCSLFKNEDNRFIFDLTGYVEFTPTNGRPQFVIANPANPDYSWVKVKRYVDDPELSWEERYRRLESHHEKETTFLIGEVEKLRATVAGLESERDRLKKNLGLASGPIWKLT